MLYNILVPFNTALNSFELIEPLLSRSNILNTLNKFYYLYTTEFYKHDEINYV